MSCPPGELIGSPRTSLYESQNKTVVSKQVPVEYIYGCLNATGVLGLNQEDPGIICGYLCGGLLSAANLELH